MGGHGAVSGNVRSGAAELRRLSAPPVFARELHGPSPTSGKCKHQAKILLPPFSEGLDSVGDIAVIADQAAIDQCYPAIRSCASDTVIEDREASRRCPRQLLDGSVRLD